LIGFLLVSQQSLKPSIPDHHRRIVVIVIVVIVVIILRKPK
jgi:hypothetical protein